MKDNQFVYIAGGVLLAAIIFQTSAKAAVDAVANVNEGTPFEGTGALGTIGNITNKASGGFLGRIGSAIGGTLADARERILGIGL